MIKTSLQFPLKIRQKELKNLKNTAWARTNKARIARLESEGRLLPAGQAVVDRARADGKGAHWGARPVVHAKHGLHRELLEHAVFDHFAGTAAAFFCGLENEVHGAIEVAVFGEVLGSSQKHGGVAIVAASVHLAGVFAGMRKGVELLHGQGVNVGTQSNASTTFAAVTAVNDTDNTCGAHAAVNGNAPVSKLLGDHVGCALFFEAQLGVSVYVFANGRNAGRVCEDGVDDFHDDSLARVAPMRYNPSEHRGH